MHKLQPNCLNGQLTGAREAGPKAWEREREKPGLLASVGVSHAAYHLTPEISTGYTWE